MEQITITLNDPTIKTYLDQVIAAGDFGNPSDYVASLIKADRRRRARAELEALLLEGLEGEPMELTDQDWDEMRRKYDERCPEAKKT